MENRRNLLLYSDHPAGWALPLWASFCGSIAARTWPLSPQEVLRLLLALLLMGIGWGRFWRALARTDWATPLKRWRAWSVAERQFVLPYARPGSPADSLARWLGQLTLWGRLVFLPAAGHALKEALVGAGTALILAAALGEGMVVLTLGGIALAQIALLQSGGKGNVGPGWHAWMGVGFPWLAGHLALAPLSLPSFVLAGAFSCAAYGWSRAAEHSGPLAWSGGYIGAAALFLITGRPLVIPYLVLLMVLPLIASSGNPGGWRPRVLWLAGGMLLAAVAL